MASFSFITAAWREIATTSAPAGVDLASFGTAATEGGACGWAGALHFGPKTAITSVAPTRAAPAGASADAIVGQPLVLIGVLIWAAVSTPAASSQRNSEGREVSLTTAPLLANRIDGLVVIAGESIRLASVGGCTGASLRAMSTSKASSACWPTAGRRRQNSLVAAASGISETLISYSSNAERKVAIASAHVGPAVPHEIATANG